MNTNWKNGLAVTMGVLLMGLSPIVNAEEATTTVNGAGSTTATTTATPSKIKIIGGIDLRPSWTTQTGEFHSENNLMLGTQLTKDTSVYGVYNFNTNLHDPADDPTVQGLNFTDVDLSVRAKVNNIAEIGSTGIKLSYENRVYLPILTSAQKEGYITSIRNYFKFKKEISPAASITLTEMPILHLYSRSSNATADGISANKYFENRVYLMGDINFSDKLSLNIPVMFHLTRYSNVAVGAKNNNAWSYFAWINPELTYQIDDNFAVALGYYSDNLVAPDLSKLTLSDGLEKGVLQISMQASL